MAFSRPARCLDRALRPEPLAALVLIALLAACQPLPHPFAEHRPPRELLVIPESVGVAIAPVEGQPAEIAARLGAVTARALLEYEIPASEKTSGRGSYQLYGHLTLLKRGDKSAVAVRWRLEDAKGHEVGQRGVGIEGTEEEWRSAATAMVDRLAALSAGAVAPMLVRQPAASRLAALTAPATGPAEPAAAMPGLPPSKPPPPETAAMKPPIADIPSQKPTASAPPTAVNQADRPAGKRLRVALRRVTGASGDGATSLARAVTGVLRQLDLTLVEAGGKADFYIDGEVSVAPVGPDKQHVKIVWRVRTESGAEIGTVGQENDVPRGMLSGPWGEVAYIVAAAAGDGLSEIFARAAPPASPADGTGTAAAAQKRPNTGSAQPGGGTAPSASSSEKAAKTKGSQ